jgi:hypothetical protein
MHAPLVNTPVTILVNWLVGQSIRVGTQRGRCGAVIQDENEIPVC